MHGHDQTPIALSRTKLFVLLGGAMVFVLLGGWMLGVDEAELRRPGRFGDPAFLRGAAIAAIVFFGLIALWILRKLSDHKPGLVLSSAGITDNASGVAAGFIPWAEIEASSVFAVQGQRMLIIHVHDPERYMERGGAFRRALNRANYKLAGSPIAIPSSTLKIGFDELQALFDRYLQAYGTNRA
jgi:hypothetical protein